MNPEPDPATVELAAAAEEVVLGLRRAADVVGGFHALTEAGLLAALS